MSEDSTTISAPIPVDVRAIPGGSRLELRCFSQAVIEDVLDALLTGGEHTLLDDVIALAAMSAEDRAALPESRMPYEDVVAALYERSSKHTHLYGERGLLLADRLGDNAVNALPVGHWAHGAWDAWKSAKAEAEAEIAAARAALEGGAAA